MSLCPLSLLREKEVISLEDGRRLGYVCDAEIDIQTGRVGSIIVPGEPKGFLRCEQYAIPWENVERIGDDTILVRLSPAECAAQRSVRKNRFG